MYKAVLIFPNLNYYKIYSFSTNKTLIYILQTKNCYKLNLYKLIEGYRIYKSYTKKLKNPKNLYKRSITGKFNKNNLYKYYI